MSTTRTITAAVAVGMALAAPATALAQDDLRTPDSRYGRPAPVSKTIDLVSPDARYGVPDGTAKTPVITVPRTRVVEVPQSGFEWGDAAIGGAATLAVLLAAGGMVLTVRPRGTAAIR
jgi:hypothetical protein